MKDVSIDSIINEPKTKNFFSVLKNNNVDVENVEVLSAQRKKNGELLFAYLKIDANDEEKNKLLPYIFIRGDAVVIVPIIRVKGKNEKYYLCVEQVRVADGAYHLEFPAGMLDENVDNPAFTAVKEMSEETGLKIDEEKLVILNDGKPLFSSPGACDEKIYYYKTDVTISGEEFAELNGKLLNNSEEDERIKLKLCRKEDFLSQTKSNMGLTALMLLEMYESKK
ncbi:MAG: NUDIX domain-containing protein [Chitinivibrionia bacterium]|nr:NUDIX domain-containing protein [Chitinivibrionia bacterium]